MRYPPWAVFDPRFQEWQAKKLEAIASAAQHAARPPSSGGRAGVVIDGVIYPLAGEPKLATTKGWGVVPGDPGR